MEALIENAKGCGIKLAVASSSDCNWVTKHLRSLDLIHHFDVIKCAEDAKHTKPHPDLYNAALEALGLAADQAIALENSLNGVKSAKAAGLFCVAIPNQITQHTPILQADVVLDSLKGISVENLEMLLNQT